jgi:hypothetical protein
MRSYLYSRSPVSTNEELLGRKSSSSGLEIREHGPRDQPRRPRGTLYPQKLALTSWTGGGGRVCSWTEAKEFSYVSFQKAISCSRKFLFDNATLSRFLYSV